MTNGLSKDFISDRSNENLLDPSSPEKLPEKVNIDYKPATGEIQMVEIAVDVWALVLYLALILFQCIFNGISYFEL